MTHPNIDLDIITQTLESLGFTARTRLEFRRDFVDIRIENGIIPDNWPKDMALPDAFFRVKVYGPGGGHYVQFDCPIGGVHVWDNRV